MISLLYLQWYICMKKTIIPQLSQEEKIEFNCECCQALGIADVVREMMEKDLHKDLRIEAKRNKRRGLHDKSR
jgi:hypothetical protein